MKLRWQQRHIRMCSLNFAHSFEQHEKKAETAARRGLGLGTWMEGEYGKISSRPQMQSSREWIACRVPRTPQPRSLLFAFP